MHEVGLCEGIVEAVEHRAAGRPVARVRIRAGALLRVVEPSLEQAFTLLAAGTVAEGAVIELTEVPAQVSCQDCAHEGEASDVLATCPLCGGSGLRFSGGDELVLESITLRQPVAGGAAAAKG